MRLTKQQMAVLGAIELDAELSAPEIAKRCRLKIPTVQRIIGRLVESGLLVGRTAVIDVTKLGLIEHGFNFSFASVTKREREAVVKYLLANREVSWLANVGGRFDVMSNIVARTPHDVVEFLRRLSARFPAAIASKTVCQRTERMRFWRGFLGARTSSSPQFHMGSLKETVRIDEVDIAILRALSATKFESFRELAASLGIPVATFLRRLGALRAKKVLAGFGYRLDLDQLGVRQFRMLLAFRDVSAHVRGKLVQVCGRNGHVKLLAVALGSWDFELEVDVMENRTIADLTSDLRETFGESVSSIEVIPILEHVKFISFPAV